MSESRSSYTINANLGFVPTPAECVAMGGHCWCDNSYNSVYLSPPREPERTCRHCGLKQRGVKQEAVKWEDVP